MTEQTNETTKISELQAKKSVRRANPKRQWGQSYRNMDSLFHFRQFAGDLVDMYAQYIEQRMPIPPGKGRGSRVQYPHVEAAFTQLSNVIRTHMLNELKGGGEEE